MKNLKKIVGYIATAFVIIAIYFFGNFIKKISNTYPTNYKQSKQYIHIIDSLKKENYTLRLNQKKLLLQRNKSLSKIDSLKKLKQQKKIIFLNKKITPINNNALDTFFIHWNKTHQFP